MAGHQIIVQLIAGNQDTERDGEIESSAGLAHVGRSQADDDTFLRKVITGTEYGAAHAILAFTYGCFRHADNRKSGQATGQEHFDSNPGRVNTELGTAIE